MAVVVLYALAGELSAAQRLGRPFKGANGFALNVPAGRAFKDPKNSSKQWIPAQVLREAFPMEASDGALRFFVRQPVPNSKAFMWLLMDDPHEQILVENNLLQVQVATAEEPPVLARGEQDVWFQRPELDAPPKAGPTAAPAAAKGKANLKPRRGSNEGGREKRDATAAAAAAAAARLSSKAEEMQDKLQKTSKEVATNLNKFASWAKRGIAAATDAIAMTDTYALQERTVTVRRKLADGGFSEVFLVKCNDSGDEFALKRCLAHSADDVRDIKAEMALHRKASSKFVMELIDHAEEASQRVKGAHELMMLFPLYNNGSLFDQMDAAVKESRPWPFSEAAAAHFTVGLLEGLEAVHRAGFVHRDIKPHNVLLCPGPGGGNVQLPEGFRTVRPILMDLGSAAPRRIEIKTRQEALMAADEASVKCSAPYRAPELFEVPSLPFVLDEKVDVWSVGTTLYALTLGRMYSPFEHPTHGLLTLAIRQASVQWPKSSGYSDTLVRILKKTLAKDPAARPSVPELRKALAKLAAA